MPVQGRRSLLATGLTAATAGLVTRQPHLIKAADGDPLVLGSRRNASTSETRLTGSSKGPALSLRNEGGGVALLASTPGGIGIVARGFELGVDGRGEGSVSGTGSDFGVRAVGGLNGVPAVGLVAVGAVASGVPSLRSDDRSQGTRRGQ